jgi:carbamoyltransferase
MIILGLNAFHADSSAAIIRDGKLVAAAEEERFCRVKHWAGFPKHAIDYCLAEAGVQISDVEHIAVNQNNRANLLKKARHVLLHGSELSLIIERLKNRAARASIPKLIEEYSAKEKYKGKFHQVEHHLAHLSSAFHVSPFDDAVVVSVDGFGDFSSAAWGVGRGTEIRIDGRVDFPHSLGIFYQALTQFLGFPHYGDEYKVMGLAPYGKPTKVNEMRRIVRLESNGAFELDLRYFIHHKQPIAYQWPDGSPNFANLFSPALEELLGPRRDPSDPLDGRHHDIARSAQAMYEEAFFNIIDHLQRKSGCTNLALAGGCAMNSVANGKVRRVTKFDRVYVQAAAGDAGGAIGAAYSVWHDAGHGRSFVMDHGYWGPWYSRQAIQSLLSEKRKDLEEAQCSVTVPQGEMELCKRTAGIIADGKVVGWFQGRMEWGPRALGNRSILCDPRRGDMKARLNDKIKRRESFRPFAPSVLEEEVGNWFEEDDSVPFMMQVFQIREERRPEIPAVTHVDGSGRLQTVSRRTNPRYYQLIDQFKKLTGIPMVLNTSFNENEPIVCRPDEALDCFLRTKMDTLVLGDFLIER